MEHYIGDKEIMTVVVLDTKTPAGEDIVCVQFTDGTKQEMPKQRLNLLSTDKRSDLAESRNMLTARVAAICFASMHEYGIKWGEVNAVMDAVVQLADNGMAKASNILFEVEYKDDITLNQINDILVKNHESTESSEEDDDGATPDGGGPGTEDKG